MLNFLKKYDLYLLALLMYLPFIFLGYGSDMDTYRVLWTGKRFITLFDYVPSRPPGFLVFETITNLLNQLGGSLLTNLGVLAMSLVILYSYQRILKYYAIPHARLLVLSLMVLPWYWAASTCTMDYCYALGFSLLAFVLLLDGKGAWAGIAIGLAIGSRISAGITCAGIWLFLMLSNKPLRRQLWICALAAGLVGILVYVPSADFKGWNLSFLKPAVGGSEYWSLFLRAGRFFYKSLTFWSIPVVAVIIGVLVYGLTRLKLIRQSVWAQVALFSLMMVLAYEAFYFYIPTEPTYLLPGVPFMLILLGIILKDKRRVLVLIFGLLLVSNFVTIEFARPNLVNKATAAEYGFWVTPGHLVEDVQARTDLAVNRFQYEPSE